MRVTIVRIQRLVGGWLVTVTDAADRVISMRVPDGSAAETREVLKKWLNL